MALRLEIFDEPGSTDLVARPFTAAALEEAKHSAYEAGYAAGWEDASRALADADRDLRNELSRSLQGLSFTFHEARLNLLLSLEPLMRSISGRLLPDIAQKALAPVILQELQSLAEDITNAPLQLRLNPVSRPAAEALLQGTSLSPVELIDDTVLGPGQASLRWPDRRYDIDLDRVSAQIGTALAQLFTLSRKDLP